MDGEKEQKSYKVLFVLLARTGSRYCYLEDWVMLNAPNVDTIDEYITEHYIEQDTAGLLDKPELRDFHAKYGESDVIGIRWVRIEDPEAANPGEPLFESRPIWEAPLAFKLVVDFTAHWKDGSSQKLSLEAENVLFSSDFVQHRLFCEFAMSREHLLKLIENKEKIEEICEDRIREVLANDVPEPNSIEVSQFVVLGTDGEEIHREGSPLH